MAAFETAEIKMRHRGELVGAVIALERPDLLDLYFTYQNEAKVARKLLDINLKELNVGAEILEVGGGILALSIQLASEGFNVTTVEPVVEGFTGIAYIMKVFLDIAKNENVEIQFVDSAIEDCNFENRFDFIYSINVMEHLEDPYSVLVQLVELLKDHGKYRFVCPNYDFPYEPHFGKWLFSRRNNAFYLPKSRAKSSQIPTDQTFGLFQTLNFLTLRKINKSARKNQIKIQPNSKAFFEILQRSSHDSELRKRHSVISQIAKLISLLKINYIAKTVPVNFQPIMDVEASLSRN